MSGENFSELSLSMFKECAAQMKQDEFIFSDVFDSKKAMSSLEVGGKRLDSHLMSEGHHTTSDIMANSKILDEELSDDQIEGICGKFIDLQASRIDGHCFLTNVLTSIYMQKDYEIKNPTLNLLFKLFSHTCFKIEEYTYNFRLICSFWALNNRYTNLFVKQDNESEFFDQLRKYDFSEPLKKIVEFEIDLCNFINDTFTYSMNPNFEITDKTNSIGIDKFLHYRDSTPSTPPSAPQIPNHEEALKILHQFIDEVSEFKTLFPSEMRITKLIENIMEWNEKGSHISLARFVLIERLLQEDTVFMKTLSYGQYLKNELTLFNVNSKYFSHKSYPDVATNFKDIFCPIIQHLISPIPSAAAYLIEEATKLWGYFQTKGFEHHYNAISKSDLPKCVNQDQQKIAELVFPLWSTQIASQLLLLAYRWEYKSEIYSLRDIHIILYCCQFSARMAAIALSQSRTAEAVYRVKPGKKKTAVWHRREADVKKMIRDRSAPEIYYNLVEQITLGCVKTLSILKHFDSLDIKYGLFFNEKTVFQNRISTTNFLIHINTPTYKDFMDAFSLPLLEINNLNAIKMDVSNTFASAKDFLNQYKNALQKTTPEIIEMLRCIAANSIFISKYTPDKKVRVSYEHHFMWPIFEFI